MKKILGVIVMLGMLVPAAAHSGSGYFTFSVQPAMYPLNYWVSTGVHISNVATVAQSITIQFFNMDGTPLANFPYTYRLGNNPVTFAQGTTDAQGRATLQVPGLGSAYLSLNTDGVLHSGLGIITGSISHGVIANVLINTPDNPPAFSIPITVNGGSPF